MVDGLCGSAETFSLADSEEEVAEQFVSRLRQPSGISSFPLPDIAEPCCPKIETRPFLSVFTFLERSRELLLDGCY